MAKRGSRRGKPGTARIAGNKVHRGLYDAYKLMESERYLEARRALQELDEQFPCNAAVLRELVNACYYLKDKEGYQYAAERLSRIAPDDPEVALGLAGAYMTNLRLTLALRSFRRFLERWPEDERAAQVKQTIATLEPKLIQRLRALGFTEEEMDELGALHDESQVLMEYGRYPEARRVAEELIERKPKFTPVRNNLSLMWAMDGNLDAAIAVAEETLEIEPANYHTLGNLVRFHVLRGQIEQARQYAKRLEPAVDEEMVDIWLKKIEAFSFLGDDQNVIAVFSQAQDSKHHEALKFTPLIFHFTAVAEMRLGNEGRARELWQQALESSPGLETARENFDDMSKPVAERHAPWSFQLSNWVSQRTVDDLIIEIKSANERSGDRAVTAAVRRYINQHPELTALVPILLDRGDPGGRELAMRLATLAKTPEMLAALHDFALSKRGPDQLRYRAAEIAREEGLLPEGPVRLWVQGKWTEVIQTLNEIHFEPLFNHRPEVSKLLAEGIETSRKGDGLQSEQLFRQALQLEPDSPDILNNLASAYKLQGRLDEAERIIRQIHQQYPDYLFGVTNLARIHIHHREFEKAAELLKPLLSSRKLLHHDEMIAVIEANIQLYLAKKEADHARQWLDMWEKVDPADPRLPEWRLRFEIAGLPEKFKRFLERNSSQ